MKLAAYLKKHQLSQANFARKFKPPVTQGAVWQWLSWLEDPDAEGMARITAERAIEIEEITKGEVARHDLRPDLFSRVRAA